MKGRLSKVSVLFLALVVALASLGAAFAAWTDTLTISGTATTGELCVGLGAWTTLDPEQGPGWPPDYYSGVPDLHCLPGFVFVPGVGVSWPDPDGKNVGWTVLTAEGDACGSGLPDVLKVDLHNVYPSYFNSIQVYPVNTGTIPWKIWAVKLSWGDTEEWVYYENFYKAMDLSGNGILDVEIQWQDNFGIQKHPGDQPTEISFWIHILQDEGEGVQNQTFTFTIELMVVQWNEYTPGPLLP